MHSEVAEGYDITIIGAGPAGSTCALALQHSGLRVILVDKASFPRDKVCGDAIPARCEKVLRSIDPRFGEQLIAFHEKTVIKGCRVVAPNLAHFDYYFHTHGYCSKRVSFDDFLLRLVMDNSSPDYLEGFQVDQVDRVGEMWSIRARDGRSLKSRAVVGCDGAQSVMARHLANFKMDSDHHCAAVRGYYYGIQGLDPNKMEIHFLDKHLPGYFWIFPLPGGWANVGFGMLSSRVSEKKIRLRQSLEEIVSTSPGLKERFAGAKLEGEIKGFGLPLGSRKVKLSGDGFLLCGDAASLIEPATGEGIGNAMLSGKLAAECLIEGFVRNDLSAGSLGTYDKLLYDKIWKDLRRKYLAQKYLGERRKLMNWLVNRARKPGPVQWIMKKVF